MFNKIIFCTIVIVMTFSTIGCNNSSENGNIDELAAEELLNLFLKPEADTVALTSELKPSNEDYKAYFSADVLEDMKLYYDPMWNELNTWGGIAPNDGQTDLLLWSATVNEIKNSEGDSDRFPGGYFDAINSINDGYTIYRFKFVQAGNTLGMAFDGLVKIDDHWVFFPKPWRGIN